MLEQNTARMNVTAALERKEEALADAGELTLELQKIEECLRELAQDKVSVLEDLKNSEQAEREADARVLKLQGQLLNLSADESDESEKVSEWEMKLQSFKQTLDFHEQNVNRIESEIVRYNRERDEILKSIEESKQDVIDTLKYISEGLQNGTFIY